MPIAATDPHLDHVVVVVGSLAGAKAAFESAGFTVVAGGRHDALPTENALVCFADGSYLELLATRDPETRDELRALRSGAGWERHLKTVSAVARRFLPSLAGPDGVADWVVRTDSLARPAGSLRSAGLKAAGPVAMSRERPDGERLSWELLLPEFALHPFWIADRTPRERRVPADAGATNHANGAVGIGTVRVRAPNLPMAALELGDVLGTPPRAESGVTALDLGGVRIEVVDGEPEGACGVTLVGCGALPEAIGALGITPASD